MYLFLLGWVLGSQSGCQEGGKVGGNIHEEEFSWGSIWLLIYLTWIMCTVMILSYDWVPPPPELELGFIQIPTLYHDVMLAIWAQFLIWTCILAGHIGWHVYKPFRFRGVQS